MVNPPFQQKLRACNYPRKEDKYSLLSHGTRSTKKSSRQPRYEMRVGMHLGATLERDTNFPTPNPSNNGGMKFSSIQSGFNLVVSETKQDYSCQLLACCHFLPLARVVPVLLTFFPSPLVLSMTLTFSTWQEI